MFYVYALLNVLVLTASSDVTIEFQPEIIRFRQSLYIICTVNDIEMIDDKLTREWSKGSNIISYNGILPDSKKYTEILTSGNQFKLQIKNVTESDINCAYRCRYGFKSKSKELLLSKDTFEYPPENDTKAEVRSNGIDSITIEIHFEKIYPVPRCTALIQGSQFPFSVTTSKSNGIFYDVDVHLRVKVEAYNKYEKISVNCKLIEFYNISTEDVWITRVWPYFEGATPVTLIIILVCAVLVMSYCVLVYQVSRRTRRKVKWLCWIFPTLSEPSDTVDRRENIQLDDIESQTASRNSDGSINPCEEYIDDEIGNPCQH